MQNKNQLRYRNKFVVTDGERKQWRDILLYAK